MPRWRCGILAVLVIACASCCLGDDLPWQPEEWEITAGTGAGRGCSGLRDSRLTDSQLRMLPEQCTNMTKLAHDTVETLHDLLWDSTAQATRPCVTCPSQQEYLTSLFTSTAYMYLQHDVPGVSVAEISSLLHGRWVNGKLPTVNYINFTNPVPQFPPPQFWQTTSKTLNKIPTSGLASLPLHASALLANFYLSQSPQTFVQTLTTLYPIIFNYHQFLYSYRVLDPSTNLVYITHPWESGADALSPLLEWVPECGEGVEVPTPPPSVTQRPIYPGDADYKRGLCLAACARDQGYDEAGIRKHCGYVVESAMFNAMLVRANHDLSVIARFVGRDDQEIAKIQGWADATQASLIKYLLDNSTMTLIDRKWVGGSNYIVGNTTSVGTLMPLMASIKPYGTQPGADLILSTPWREGTLRSLLSDNFLPGYLAPSLSRVNRRFSPAKGMDGPVWLYLDYLLWQSLNKGKYPGIAAQVKFDSLHLSCAAASVAEESSALLTHVAWAEAFNADTGAALHNSSSATGAAVFVLLALPPGTPFAPQSVPLSYGLLIVFVVLELVFVFVVGSCCVIFSISAIRQLRREARVEDSRKPVLSAVLATGVYANIAGEDDASGRTPLLATDTTGVSMVDTDDNASFVTDTTEESSPAAVDIPRNRRVPADIVSDLSNDALAQSFHSARLFRGDARAESSDSGLGAGSLQGTSVDSRSTTEGNQGGLMSWLWG